MYIGSVGAGFVLALPFHHGDLEPDCQVGVSTRGGSGGRARRARRIDVPSLSGRLASFSVEGQGSRALPQSSWRIHGGGGGLMCKIKIENEARILYTVEKYLAV